MGGSAFGKVEEQAEQQQDEEAATQPQMGRAVPSHPGAHLSHPTPPQAPKLPFYGEFSETLGALMSDDSDGDDSDDGGFLLAEADNGVGGVDGGRGDDDDEAMDAGSGVYEEMQAEELQRQRQRIKRQLDHFFPLTVYQVGHGRQMPLSRDHPLHGPQPKRVQFEQERAQFVALAGKDLMLDPLDHDFAQHWL